MAPALQNNMIRNKACRLIDDIILRKHFVPVCVALAVLIRLLWIALMDTQPVSDFRWYYDRAIEISRGNGYVIDATPTAYWSVAVSLAEGGIVCLLFARGLILVRKDINDTFHGARPGFRSQ